MNKKIILVIIILLAAIILAMGFINNSQQVEIGEVTFQIPNNYKVIDDVTRINITSDDASISLIKNVTDEDLNNSINYYVHVKELNNASVQVTKLHSNNGDIYKTNIVNGTATLNYWFTINDKLYHMYTWSGNQNTDNLVIELINSMEINS